MGNQHYQRLAHASDGLPAFLAVLDAVLLCQSEGIVEYLRWHLKIQIMLALVDKVLDLVPFKYCHT